MRYRFYNLVDFTSPVFSFFFFFFLGVLFYGTLFSPSTSTHRKELPSQWWCCGRWSIAYMLLLLLKRKETCSSLNCVFVVFFTFSFRVGFYFLLPHDAGRLVAGPDAFSSSWCWPIGCGSRCLHGCRSDTFMPAVTFRISSHWER